MKIYILIAILFAILFVYGVFVELIKRSEGKYASKILLTDNEKEFYFRLKRALAGYEVFPQVAMGAVLNPNVDRSNRRYYKIRGTFSQKIIDYVICDGQTLEVIAIVELDDRTHNSGRDQQRDAMLQCAGYSVIRWDSRRKPSVDDIQQEVSRIRNTRREQQGYPA